MHNINAVHWELYLNTRITNSNVAACEKSTSGKQTREQNQFCKMGNKDTTHTGLFHRIYTSQTHTTPLLFSGLFNKKILMLMTRTTLLKPLQNF